jgi:hypothetical protein
MKELVTVADGFDTHPLRKDASAAPIVAGDMPTIDTVPPGVRGATQ